MEIVNATQVPSAHKMDRPQAAAEKESRAQQNPASTGRRHVQRETKHLLREIRHEIKAELKELKGSEDYDTQYAASVNSLLGDFRDELQSGFHDLGKGNSFNSANLTEKIGTAMSNLTQSLAKLRPQEEPGEPVAVPQKDLTDEHEMADSPSGLLLDITA